MSSNCVLFSHSVPYDGLPDYFLAFDLFDRLTGNFVSVRTLSTLLADTSIKMVIILPAAASASAAASAVYVYVFC